MEQKTSNEKPESSFTRRVEELRAVLGQSDPRALAKRTGAAYEPAGEQKGVFQLQFMGQPILLHFPDLIVLNQHQEPASLAIQALILYYFHTAHGPAPSGQWISFSELPDGKFYNQAFQGYSGKQIARTFGNDTAAVLQAAQKAGAGFTPLDGVTIGDFAGLFQVLPYLPVLLVGWQGDEDFPASYQLLFDLTASNYLPTEFCAIV